MTIRHDEVSLRRSAAMRFSRATEDLRMHTIASGMKGLFAGLILVLLALGIVVGVHLMR